MQPIQPEVPVPYAEEYTEACEVLPISPKSSAVLARRILQALLLDPNAGGLREQQSDNLAKQINRVAGIPAIILEQLHLLREIGNFGAHQQLDRNTAIVLPIEPREAEFALKVIHQLFDHYFVAPAKAAAIKANTAAMKAQFNAEKLLPAGKRPIR